MDDLFRAIREQCPAAVWSRGVELARQDAVTGDRETAEEIALRVANKDTGLSAEVVLLPLDEEWQCSCNGPDDPCAHVAAAVIALRRARERGDALPRSAKAGGRLVYRLARTPAGLTLARVVIDDQGETVLTVALSALTSGRVKGPGTAATADDHEIESALDGHRQGPLPARLMPRLLRALARLEAGTVTLDGLPVTLDGAPLGLIVEVVDDGPGVRAVARQDPAIVELFANGAAATATALRPVVLPALDPLEQRLLKDGRLFGPMEFGYLTSEILPKLEAKLPVRVLSAKLPRQSRAKPELELELTPLKVDARPPTRLRVVPLLAYVEDGSKIAEVRAGRLYTLGQAVPVRDQDQERRLKDELYRTWRLNLDEASELDTAAALQLAASLRRPSAPRTSGDGFRHFTLSPGLKPEIRLTEGGFDISFTVAADADSTSDSTSDDDDHSGAGARRQAAPAAVFAAWRDGASHVPLIGGGFAPLPTDWLTRYGARIADLLAARNDGGTLPKALLPTLATLGDELDLPTPAGLRSWHDRLTNGLAGLTAAGKPYVPATDLQATLRSYQHTGAAWLATLRQLGLGAMLCDDMGLGKTLQAITALEGPSLVVAPTSVLRNWEKELARFRPGLRVSVFHGPGRRLKGEDADVVLTTYAVLRLDIELLAAASWRVVVLDEAQTIKNPDSQAARAAFRLQADFRLALSGTPVENRPSDLWSQMHFANPGLLGTRADYEARFGRPMTQGDSDAGSRLAARIRPFILRRLKRDVAPELPPRTEIVRHVELSAAERALYDSVQLAARRDVLTRLGAGGSVFEALEALLRLRQAACHPALVPGAEPTVTSAKLDLLVETLEEAVAEGHKALVFSQWTSFLDLMEPAFKAAGLRYLRLDGATLDRAAVVEQFQAADGPPLLIMSLKAGGVGLNLTAADHVFLTDPWWNPAAEDQAADRAHRIGQDRPVLVQRLVTLGTVEERILALQEHKRALAAAALGADSAAAGTLTRDDLLNLLA